MGLLLILWVRIHLKTESERFYRCGIKFSREWQKLTDIDAATAKALHEEQMLEVTETKPADYVEPAATDAPTAPAVTDVPAAPTATDAPTVPAATDAPTAPAATDAPTAPAATDVPAAPAATDAPAAPAVTDVPAAPAATAAPTDPAERAAAIKDAIATLDKSNAALWTGTGMPKMPAIAAVTGWEVTQAERDAVWAEIGKA
jgi:hypothetical protein